MAKANDRMELRVLSAAELELVAGGNGATVTHKTFPGPDATLTVKHVITPSGNVTEQITETTTFGNGVIDKTHSVTHVT
jgi:hypothetical protein